MIIERKFQHIFFSLFSAIVVISPYHCPTATTTCIHSTIRSRSNVVCFMSRTQQNVYDAFELKRIMHTTTRAHTHKHNCFSGRLNRMAFHQHTTRTNTTSIQISPWKLWFLAFLHDGETAAAMEELRKMSLVRAIIGGLQTSGFDIMPKRTHTFVVSSQYVGALEPLLFYLDWCNFTFGPLNCTCTACMQHTI